MSSKRNSAHFPDYCKGILRCDDEKDVLMAGFIWDNLPLVEKTIDAIDFTRLRPAVKINKFPGFLDLNRCTIHLTQPK